MPLNEKSNHNATHEILGEGRFALGIAVGVFLMVAVYLVSDVFSVGLTSEEILDAVPSLLALLVALVSLLISYNAFSEQRRMRQAGTDPVVLVHLGKREDTNALATFEVSNVGAGAALEVRVEFETDISEYVPDRIITDFGGLKAPIRTIPQGKSISYNFGVGHSLLAEPKIPPLEVRVRYQNIDGVLHDSFQTIDVRELSLQRADKPVGARVASSIEQIEKSLKKISRHDEIHVVAESQKEFEKRRSTELKRLHSLLDSAKERKNGNS